MLENIVLLIFLSYRNNVKAKRKGLNGMTWSLITAGVFLCGMMAGSFAVMLSLVGNGLIDVNVFAGHDLKAQDAAVQQLSGVLNSNWLYPLTIEFFAIGGYLIVRYILDKKPEKKTPEIHWMDKIGEQDQ